MTTWLRYARAYAVALVPNRVARALLVQIAIIFALSFVAALVADRLAHSDPPWARARVLARSNKIGEAEAVYWEHLKAAPVTLPLLVEFLDNHRMATLVAHSSVAGLSAAEAHPFVVSEGEIDALFEGSTIPPEVARLGLFWRHVVSDTVTREERIPIVAAADAEPPVPWANRLLAREAIVSGGFEHAAPRFEREGLNVPEHKEDVNLALRIYLQNDEWEKVDARLNDPRFDGLVDPHTRYAHALRARAWPRALKWLVIANSSYDAIGPVVLAAISGLLWFFFCARLGKLRERPRVRLPLFVLAVVLGLASIYPTLVVIGVEEDVFHFTRTANPARDAIYFVVGVGLREEVCKLLLFAPLLPLLRKFGTRLDVFACGALVGLGFAAQENVNYFSSGALSLAIARFVTANFMHIAMTAIIAGAAFDALYEPRKNEDGFLKSFGIVVALHGAYDYFLSVPLFDGLSFFSMGIFFVLTRRFLRGVDAVRGRPEADAPLLRRFVQALAIVTGASFVYAASLVGPKAALAAQVESLLGFAIIIYMFVREMRSLEA